MPSKTKHLITLQEVISHSPAGAHYDPKLVKTYIGIEEKKLARTCLGKTFYQELLDCIQCYDEAEIWKENETYSQGEIVHYNSIVYISCKDGNNAHPQNGKAWDCAPKMCECYQEFWEDYLCPLISFKVLASSIITSSVKAEATGLVRVEPDGSKAASLEELSAFKNSLAGNCKDIIDNMQDYVDCLNQDDECFLNFGNFDKCKKQSCSPKKGNGRIYGFSFN